MRTYDIDVVKVKVLDDYPLYAQFTDGSDANLIIKDMGNYGI